MSLLTGMNLVEFHRVTEVLGVEDLDAKVNGRPFWQPDPEITAAVNGWIGPLHLHRNDRRKRGYITASTGHPIHGLVTRIRSELMSSAISWSAETFASQLAWYLEEIEKEHVSRGGTVVWTTESIVTESYNALVARLQGLVSEESVTSGITVAEAVELIDSEARRTLEKV